MITRDQALDKYAENVAEIKRLQQENKQLKPIIFSTVLKPSEGGRTGRAAPGEIEARVLATLKQYGESMTAREIAETETLNYDSVTTALRKLCSKGFVAQDATSKKYLLCVHEGKD